MSQFTLYKQPSEETTFAVDFAGTRELQDGETIASIAASCTLDGEDAEGIIVSSSHTDDTVKVRVEGGVDGQDYLVTILATTDQGHVREADVELRVREEPE